MQQQKPFVPYHQKGDRGNGSHMDSEGEDKSCQADAVTECVLHERDMEPSGLLFPEPFCKVFSSDYGYDAVPVPQTGKTDKGTGAAINLA